VKLSELVDVIERLIEFVKRHPIYTLIAVLSFPFLVVVIIPILLALLFIQTYIPLLELYAKYQAVAQWAWTVFTNMLWIIAAWVLLFNGALALYMHFVVKPYLSRLQSKENEKTMKTE